MTNRVVVQITVFLSLASPAVYAAERGSCVLGSCQFNSESYTGEACDATNLASSSLSSSPMSSAEKAMMNSALAKAKSDMEKLTGKDGAASSVLADVEVGGNGGRGRDNWQS